MKKFLIKFAPFPASVLNGRDLPDETKLIEAASFIVTGGSAYFYDVQHNLLHYYTNVLSVEKV